METTANNNVATVPKPKKLRKPKTPQFERRTMIMRLRTGEDIIADTLREIGGQTIMANNPMHIIFKRAPNEQAVMVILPWLPMGLITHNDAILSLDDILTVFTPREQLIEYYNSIVAEVEKRMSDHDPLGSLNDMIKLDENELEDKIEQFINKERDKLKDTLH